MICMIDLSVGSCLLFKLVIVRRLDKIMTWVLGRLSSWLNLDVYVG